MRDPAVGAVFFTVREESSSQIREALLFEVSARSGALPPSRRQCRRRAPHLAGKRFFSSGASGAP